ncbi:unnamed protein product, partial [marine sediment metagenome]
MVNALERRLLIANKIRAAREQLRMSQAELGRALGRSHVAISNLERGLTKLEITELDRIAQALGHSLDYFISDVPSPPPISPQQLQKLSREMPIAIPITRQESWQQRPQPVLGYAYWRQDEVGGREIRGLRVKGTPVPPLIEDEDTVFFIVGKAPESGDLVVATVDNRTS